jgi:hypothetical protein
LSAQEEGKHMIRLARGLAVAALAGSLSVVAATPAHAQEEPPYPTNDAVGCVLGGLQQSPQQVWVPVPTGLLDPLFICTRVA